VHGFFSLDLTFLTFCSSVGMHVSLALLIHIHKLTLNRDQTPPNTPQRARIASQRFEQENRVLDSPQRHCVPQNLPHIAPPFQLAQDDIFGGGPISDRRRAQAFLANLNFQHGNAAPQLTPNSMILAQEHLAQLQHPLEFNPAPALGGRHQPPEPLQQPPNIQLQGPQLPIATMNSIQAIQQRIAELNVPREFQAVRQLQIPPVPPPALPNIQPVPQNIPPEAPKARDPKPGFPHLLYCTSGRHYRHQTLFEENSTCSECREKNRRKAQIAAARRAEEQRQA
jgi:hypothetical protein